MLAIGKARHQIALVHPLSFVHVNLLDNSFNLSAHVRIVQRQNVDRTGNPQLHSSQKKQPHESRYDRQFQHQSSEETEFPIWLCRRGGRASSIAAEEIAETVAEPEPHQPSERQKSNPLILDDQMLPHNPGDVCQESNREHESCRSVGQINSLLTAR